MKVVRIKKDKSTPEKEKFWTSAEEAMQEINSWPEWKQNYLEFRIRDKFSSFFQAQSQSKKRNK